MVAAVCQLCEAEFEIEIEDEGELEEESLDAICGECYYLEMCAATSDWHSM